MFGLVTCFLLPLQVLYDPSNGTGLSFGGLGAAGCPCMSYVASLSGETDLSLWPLNVLVFQLTIVNIK